MSWGRQAYPAGDLEEKLNYSEDKGGESPRETSFQFSCHVMYSLTLGAPGLNSIHKCYLNEIIVLVLKGR